MRTLIAVFLVAACATAPQAEVRLVSIGVVPVAETADEAVYAPLVEVLSRGMPFGPDAEQTLSLFGREDLIAATSIEYAAEPIEGMGKPCEASEEDLLGTIAAKARGTRVVVVNESHVRSLTRVLTEDVAKVLRPLGFTHFAAETFYNAPDKARVETPQDEPYLQDEHGYYLKESQFGRMLRTVKALGYELVPYEFTTPPDEWPADPEAMANMREAEQAAYLAERVLTADPEAKLLVHVGYGHGSEEPSQPVEGQTFMMAGRLAALTGIDPLTVNQTLCRGGEDLSLAVAKSWIRMPGFDLDVTLPHPSFTRSRPDWRLERGDQAVDIPAGLLPTGGAAHVIEARIAREPERAIPMDRVLVRSGEDVALMLPPGEYAVRAVALPGPD